MNPIYVALIGALSGVLAAAVPVVITNRRHPSRSAQDGASIVEAAEGVVMLLRHELTRLAARVDILEDELRVETQHTDGLARQVDDLRRDNGRLLHGVNLLIAQLRRLGYAPDWHPETDVTGTPT